MPTRLVIFDFDGTLADSLPWFRSVFNEVARRYGFRELEPAELEELRRLGNREILARIQVPRWKLPLIAAHMRRRMARDIGGIELFPGVPDLLRRLHGDGIGLAIVSSNTEPNVRAVLGPDLAALVRHYGCGTSLFGKAAQIRKTLARTGTATTEVLCIGDEVRDLDAARAAGVPCAAVAWGYADPTTLIAHGNPLLFNRVEEIIEALGGAHRRD